MKNATKVVYACLCVVCLALGVFQGDAHGALSGVTAQASYKGIDVDAVEKGHQFVTVVKIAPTTGTTETLYGASIDIMYDHEYLELVNVTPLDDRVTPRMDDGGLLSGNGTEDIFMLGGLVNKQPGHMTVGITRKGNVDGVAVADGGVLVSVYFQGLKVTPEGNGTSVRFGLSGLRDKDLAEIDAGSWTGDSFTIVELIIAKLDINDDEVIDLKDVILALQVLTNQPTAEEVHIEADFSGDKRIGLAEATGILQVLAGQRSAP
jgi:hypothetical protein